MKTDLFNNFHSKVCTETDMEALVAMMHTSPVLKQSTQEYRNLLAQLQAEEQQAMRREAAQTQRRLTDLKQSLPQVAFAFRMEGGRKLEHCQEPLHLALIDLDFHDPDSQPDEDELEHCFSLLRTSYHTLLGHQTVSGLGYHALVPYRLPEGIVIDMQDDPRRGAELHRRAAKAVCAIIAAKVGHPIDQQCCNPNRLMALSHDPLAVYRPDAYPVQLTLRDMGLNPDGSFMESQHRCKTVNSRGERVSRPADQCLEQAKQLVQEAGLSFVKGHRHDYLMRLAFCLNRLGAEEEETATLLNKEYAHEYTEERPSAILHNCYSRAKDQYGLWMQSARRARKADEEGHDLIDTVRQYATEYGLWRKNVITNEYEVCPTGESRFRPVTDEDENNLFCLVKPLCRRLSLGDIRATLHSDFSTPYDPFREYLESLPSCTILPDGKAQLQGRTQARDYLQELADRVQVMGDHDLFSQQLRRWMVQLVKSVIMEEEANQYILVFIGAQGIYKTTFFQSLLPPAFHARYFYLKTRSDRLDRDDKLKMAQFWLFCLEEIDSMTDSELNNLKAMLTSTKVDERPAYGRNTLHLPRISSFCATGNHLNFLTDTTGNRRFLPQHVVSIDNPRTRPIDHEGIYAQAYALARDPHFVSYIDEALSQRMQQQTEQFMVPVLEHELIDKYLDLPLPLYRQWQDSEPPATIKSDSAGGIMSYLEQFTRQRLSVRRISAYLRKKGFPESNIHGNKHFTVAILSTKEVDRRQKLIALDTPQGG